MALKGGSLARLGWGERPVKNQKWILCWAYWYSWLVFVENWHLHEPSCNLAPAMQTGFLIKTVRHLPSPHLVRKGHFVMKSGTLTSPGVVVWSQTSITARFAAAAASALKAVVWGVHSLNYRKWCRTKQKPFKFLMCVLCKTLVITYLLHSLNCVNLRW